MFKHLAQTLVLGTTLVAAAAQSQTHIVNLDSRNHTPTNPVEVFFEAGTYQVSPVMPEEGAVYTGHHAWGGWTNGCDTSGANCATGWQIRMFFRAPGMGMTPSYTNDTWSEYYTCVTPYTLEDFNSGNVPVLTNGRNPTLYATQELALAAARSAGCEITFQNSGYVVFHHTDSNYGDNLGGNSFKFTRVIQEPEPVVAVAQPEPSVTTEVVLEPVAAVAASTSELDLHDILLNGVGYDISSEACELWSQGLTLAQCKADCGPGNANLECRKACPTWRKEHLRTPCQVEKWAARESDKAEHRIVKNARRAIKALDRGDTATADQHVEVIYEYLDAIADYEFKAQEAGEQASDAYELYLIHGPVDLDQYGNPVIKDQSPKPPGFGGGSQGGGSNNGHGNNVDGVDSSNPGKGNGGPNGKPDGDTDDEQCTGNKCKK